MPLPLAKISLISLFLMNLVSWNATAQSLTLIPVTQTDFSIVDRGGVSRTADGSGDSIAVGYARVQPDAGNTTPAGVAILGLRPNGTLVSEVGIPASPLLQTGRLYAEIGSRIDTGIAIANPNSQTATVSFSFTDIDGTDFGAGIAAVPPNGQISKFLDEAPFNGPTSIRGTFSFSSNVPVAAIALRGLINERGEFLMSSLPVIDLSSASISDPITIPHFADGGGWTTQIILVNPGNTSISGKIAFFAPTGEPLSTSPFSIASRSSFKLLTPGTGRSVQSGSVQISPDAASATPAGLAIFSYKPAGITVTEAAISSAAGAALRMYVEASGTPGTTSTKQSGVAVANLSTSPATVTFDLTGMDGSTLANASVTIPGNGQFAKFLNDIFAPATLPPSLQGILRVSASGSGLSVAGLRGRYNERGEFLITTTPPANEATPASQAELLFPEVVNGGGFATQFLLYSGSAGQNGTGKLRFMNPDGTALTLNWPAYRVGGGITTPTVVRRVEPSYSDAARQARITGTLLLEGVVHEDGSLSITRVVQKLGYGLDENAQSALEHWRFSPATKDGQPVAVQLNIEVNFNLL